MSLGIDVSDSWKQNMKTVDHRQDPSLLHAMTNVVMFVSQAFLQFKDGQKVRRHAFIFHEILYVLSIMPC